MTPSLGIPKQKLGIFLGERDGESERVDGAAQNHTTYLNLQHTRGIDPIYFVIFHLPPSLIQYGHEYVPTPAAQKFTWSSS